MSEEREGAADERWTVDPKTGEPKQIAAPQDGERPNLGALYAALAKAQAEFPPIPRTRTVTVRSDKGNYTFDYAPLDTILALCRPILGKYALAITQKWTGDSLETVLGHQSGAELWATVRVPAADSMQKRGAALTYLRRYSIQAILGIAAEEDTDGDADGTQAVTPRQPPPPRKPTEPHADTFDFTAARKALQDADSKKAVDATVASIQSRANRQPWEQRERDELAAELDAANRRIGGGGKAAH